MSTAAPANQPAIGIKPMQVMVFGKVENVRSYDKSIYTTVICPATDQYSSPSVVVIKSSRRLGQRDEEIRQLCKLGGYRRKPFKFTDKETGEISMVTPVDITLEAIAD
ncbi:MAG: single-stranded DNA-binding protein [Brachymonas sp.]|nr:single-stranded DNA-binding protein [Brachymonas sp.]